MTGKIEDLKETYGFIKGEDGIRYFFHKTDLLDCELRELIPDRTNVEFEVAATSNKGPRADNVKLVE